MEKRHLHLKGPSLSRIVAGAWRWDRSADVNRLINVSLECGITSFDHADIYGDYANQEIFGAALKQTKHIRQQIQIISKCGIKLISSKHPSTWIKHYDTSRAHILNSVDKSLQDLGTDYLDVLLIHRPDPFMDPEEVAETFGLLKQNGKVLHFGVSNFTASQYQMLQKFLPFPLVTNQIPLSLNNLNALYDGTIDVMLANETCPMIYSPLGAGQLMTEGSSTLWKQSEKYKSTPTQLALAWLLNHPAHFFPVIGTTKADRIEESARAITIQLDRQDWFDMLQTAAGKEVP